MKLKRESPTPLYLQLKNTLIAEINAGRYRPHQRLLSERDLCERFKVSRMTVRQTLAEMMREGWIYAVVGKGTFVNELKISQDLGTLTGFSQDVLMRGRKPSSRVVEARLTPATLSLSKLLNVSPDAEIVQLTRVRFSGEGPLCLETAHIPHRLCPNILQHDFAVESLYRVFEADYGLRLVRAEQNMEAGLAIPVELDLLEMTPPAAVMRIERLTRTDQDVVVEYVLSVYRGDRYKFHTTLEGRS